MLIYGHGTADADNLINSRESFVTVLRVLIVFRHFAQNFQQLTSF